MKFGKGVSQALASPELRQLRTESLLQRLEHLLSSPAGRGPDTQFGPPPGGGPTSPGLARMHVAELSPTSLPDSFSPRGASLPAFGQPRSPAYTLTRDSCSARPVLAGRLGFPGVRCEARTPGPLF